MTRYQGREDFYKMSAKKCPDNQVPSTMSKVCVSYRALQSFQRVQKHFCESFGKVLIIVHLCKEKLKFALFFFPRVSTTDCTTPNMYSQK
jgi:hypothetical protein